MRELNGEVCAPGSRGENVFVAVLTVIGLMLVGACAMIITL